MPDYFDLAAGAQGEKMDNSKASTLQQKFGFGDSDMKTPKHDEIMLWLNDNIQPVVEKLLKFQTVWPEDQIASCISQARKAIDNTFKTDDLGKWVDLSVDDLPSKPHPEVTVKWESPITTRSQFIVGFVDMLVTVSEFELDVRGLKMPYQMDRWQSEQAILENKSIQPSWGTWKNDDSVPIVFEVKSAIPSLGELIRQIRMYQEFLKAIYVVVCPDDRFETALAQQKIAFVKYPNR